MPPPVPHVAPLMPDIVTPEVPEVPEAIVPEDNSDTPPAKEDPVKESLDMKLRELEE